MRQFISFLGISNQSESIIMICINCTTHAPLKNLIIENNEVGVCGYCGQSNLVIEKVTLFDYIIDTVCSNTIEIEDLSITTLSNFWGGGEDGQCMRFSDLLGITLGLDREPYVEDFYAYIPSSLIWNEDGSVRIFCMDDGTERENIFSIQWGEFVKQIKHSYRFFNSHAKDFLDSVFRFLTKCGKLKPELLRSIAEGEPMYRARIIYSYQEAESFEKDLIGQFGKPPSHKASNQRMTPSGISTLYCALERETCLSEVRSITGDTVASVALTPCAEITLLDLNRLNLIQPQTPSLLDKTYREVVHFKAFIASLITEMSKPKRREDELGYLATQAVFEYLRASFCDQIHGLAFSSVQTGVGTNVVIFPEFSLIGKKEDYTPPEQIDSPFEEPIYFYIQEDSLRWHKVRSIVTQADEYMSYHNPQMYPEEYLSVAIKDKSLYDPY